MQLRRQTTKRVNTWFSKKISQLRLRMSNEQPFSIGALIPGRRGRSVVLFLAPGRADLVRDDAAHEADEVRLHVLGVEVVEAVERRAHGVLEAVLVFGGD